MNKSAFRKLAILSLCTVALSGVNAAEASTRFSFGVTSLKIDQPQPRNESKTGYGLRLAIEQEFGEHWSAELSLDGDFDIFSERKGLDAFGLYAKYRFSATPSSFYVKGGPNHSTYYTRRSSPAIKESGVGVLGAVGWQHQWSSSWGVGVEAWYTKNSSDNAIGTTLTISYGF